MGKKNRRKTTVSATSPSDAPPTPQEYPNDALVDDLLTELDGRDAELDQRQSEEHSSTTSSAQLEEKRVKRDNQARFKAREMRRMANRLAQMPAYDDTNAHRIAEETAAEEKTIHTICDKQGLRIQEINPDGHCLFAAVADQLALLSILPPAEATYRTLRQSAADYIQSHRDDFLPFLVSLSDENTDEPMTTEDFEKYCDMIRFTAAWGGEPEILALSKAYNIPIHVIQGGSPFEVIHRPGDAHAPSNLVVRISYHKRMYGLGEHYNSLRPTTVL